MFKPKLKNIILIILLLVFCIESNATILYNWSNSKIKIYSSPNQYSTLLIQIGVGDKVEKIDEPIDQIQINEFYKSDGINCRDSIELIGYFIRVKYGKIIGYCLDTYLSNLIYDKSIFSAEQISSPIEYYVSINNLTVVNEIEEEIESDGEQDISKGQKIFSDESILNYEYSGYGGGSQLRIQSDKFKEFYLLTLRIMELKSSEFCISEFNKSLLNFEIEDCETCQIKRTDKNGIIINYSFGC